MEQPASRHSKPACRDKERNWSLVKYWIWSKRTNATRTRALEQSCYNVLKTLSALHVKKHNRVSRANNPGHLLRRLERLLQLHFSS